MAKTIIGGVAEAARLARLGSDLTSTALENMKPGGVLTDKRNPGFRARRQGKGAPVLEFRYRHNDKRHAMKLGTYRRHPDDGRMPHTVLEALERYHMARDVLDRGQNPAVVKATESARTLRPALEAYGTSLAERQVVKRGEVMSLLERELLKPFGDVPLDSIARAALVKRFEEVARKRPGTAKELRTRAGVFLGWCANKGLLTTSPLDGYRSERKTRAERNGNQEHGRALEDWELPILWRAASEAKAPLGAYLLVRLLCGQRREETGKMRRRQDVDLDAGVWSIPPEVGKTRSHEVPLPRLVRLILRALPHNGPLVFAGRGGKEMSGWSKRLRPVYAATAAAGMPPWVPGDLRKTMRSGLTALTDKKGNLVVPFEVRELMISHTLPGDLERRYDRNQLWKLRQRAARRWALHVLQVVNVAKREARAAGKVVAAA